MSRQEIKEIIRRVIETMQEPKDDTPQPACMFGDQTEPPPCDVTTFYAVGEEG